MVGEHARLLTTDLLLAFRIVFIIVIENIVAFALVVGLVDATTILVFYFCLGWVFEGLLTARRVVE